MDNKKLGLFSAIVAGLSTAIFAVSMLVDMLLVSFGICMVLSWSYIALTCAFATQANDNKKAFAYAGMAFACVYAVFINLVYYTQLTTVYHQAASQDILKILTFTPGSWMFAFDIFGYGIMAISTFFVGLTIIPDSRSDKWLKTMLMLHGLFAPFCFVFPMLNLFKSTESTEAGNNMGMIALVGWCLYFIPIMVMAAKHFKKKIKA